MGTRGAMERLNRYRAGYATAGLGPTDAGIRAADAWVATHDPLRAVLRHPAWPGLACDLALGVDPGTYYCGGLAAHLAGLGVPAGFVHTPNDGNLPRAALLDFTELVVARCVRALGGGRVLVTGFGRFPGVPDNPTAAFVADPARLGAATGLVLALEAADGTMVPDMAPVIAQLAAAGGFDAVLALGVDSRQALARPRFTVETQAWGMRPALGPVVHLDALALGLLSEGRDAGA